MDIVIFEGDEGVAQLDRLARLLRSNDTYRVRFTVDQGAFKFKINEDMWSPPMGKLERHIDII
jgi:hypothetical protein